MKQENLKIFTKKDEEKTTQKERILQLDYDNKIK